VRWRAAIVAFAACSAPPRPAPAPPSTAPRPAPVTATVAPAPAPVAEAPASSEPAFPPEILVGVPASLVARSAELIGVSCPMGTKLDERIERHPGLLEIHRRCEMSDGHFEGPIVDFSTNGTHSGLWRRGEHDGLREGAFVEINASEVREFQFATGHPVGAYSWRTLRGDALVTGQFDDRGRFDGRWTFAIAGWNAEFAFKHGTGDFELHDNRAFVVYKAHCSGGEFDGPAELRLQRSYGGFSEHDHAITATYKDGLPNGPWKKTRISDGVVLEAGTYKAGEPVGTWKMVTEDLCLFDEQRGDVVDCGQHAKDVPYTCPAGKPCTYDQGPPLGRGRPSDGQPRRAETITEHRRCALPDSYFDPHR
jgi:hypothetical protein